MNKAPFSLNGCGAFSHWPRSCSAIDRIPALLTVPADFIEINGTAISKITLQTTHIYIYSGFQFSIFFVFTHLFKFLIKYHHATRVVNTYQYWSVNDSVLLSEISAIYLNLWSNCSSSETFASTLQFPAQASSHLKLGKSVNSIKYCLSIRYLHIADILGAIDNHPKI